MSRLEQSFLVAVVISLHELLLVPSEVIQKDAGCRCRNLKSQLNHQIVHCSRARAVLTLLTLILQLGHRIELIKHIGRKKNFSKRRNVMKFVLERL